MKACEESLGSWRNMYTLYGTHRQERGPCEEQAGGSRHSRGLRKSHWEDSAADAPGSARWFMHLFELFSFGGN